jgi:hypothetical protein
VNTLILSNGTHFDNVTITNWPTPSSHPVSSCESISCEPISISASFYVSKIKIKGSSFSRKGNVWILDAGLYNRIRFSKRLIGRLIRQERKKHGYRTRDSKVTII